MASEDLDDVLEPSLQNILDQDSLKWIFVGGKGGVGKTTCSCSLAIRLAEVREKVLILSTDPAHNLSDAFKQKFGSDPLLVEGHKNLYAMEIDPVPVVEKDKLEELLARDGIGGGLGSLFGGDIMKTFPDLQEVISLTGIFKKLKGLDFSVVVFDTAPTGHTLRLLSMPPEVERGLGNLMAMKDNFAGMLGPLSGIMGLPAIDSNVISSRLADVVPALRDINIEFKNPDSTTFVCVCIAEMLSLYETERLIQELTRIDIDTQNIVVNQLVYPLASTAEAKANGCKMCTARRNIQKKYLDQIDDMYEDFHVTKLPLLPNEVRGLEDLTDFSTNLIRPISPSVCPQDRMPHECAAGVNVAPPPLESSVDDLDPSLLNIVEQQSLKWIFVSGKGGVGKTTCSSALAVQLSNVREKVLIISTDPAHNLSDAFNQKFGSEPHLVTGFRNLYGMELDLAPISEAQDDVLAGDEDDSGLISLVSDFVKSFPGITEALALAEVLRMVQVLDFSAVVFDTAPTGHTLRLLSIPLAMEETLGKVMGMKDSFSSMMSGVGSMFGMGDYSPDAISSNLDGILPAIKDINKQFQDPTKTTFVCVCIAEFLSLFETERLVQELTRYRINARNIVVNQLLYPLHGPLNCDMCKARRSIQRKYLEQITELYEDFHIVKMPLLPEEIRGSQAVAQFSSRLINPYDPSCPVA
ncbi:arsenical pump-driving ATPase-like [Sycon ciliatum]|uniref:arsenical pump-driving ATPase-like n=1 Tax=Sycon ciliatum TaxID=27933 RepID=UPI0031F6DF8D